MFLPRLWVRLVGGKIIGEGRWTGFVLIVGVDVGWFGGGSVDGLSVAALGFAEGVVRWVESCHGGGRSLLVGSERMRKS